MVDSLDAAVLDLPAPPSSSLPARNSRPAEGEDGGAPEGLFCLLGSSLFVYGLTRRSWPGLLLAAVGGYFVCRGLVPRDDSLDDLTPTTETLPTELAASLAVASPDLLMQTAVLREAGIRVEEMLTAAEHAQAEVVAYFFALERGGGGLPPYDPARAVGDFCRAAEQVLRRRVLG